MRNKRYNNHEQGKGGRGRGRSRGQCGFGPGAWRQTEDWDATREVLRRGSRVCRGPGQDIEDAPQRCGPPPWAGRWGGMAEDAPGPQRRGTGRRMWEQADISAGERRAWLLARKARLQAWKQHLDDRLAETEAELAKLDTPETRKTDESVE